MSGSPCTRKSPIVGSTEGVIAEAEIIDKSLGDIKLRENPLVIVLESVEKPGNLGAVLRTADAADADAVIVCDPLTDLYNPNLIRSSLGCHFHETSRGGHLPAETLKWLNDKQFKDIYSTASGLRMVLRYGYEMRDCPGDGN